MRNPRIRGRFFTPTKGVGVQNDKVNFMSRHSKWSKVKNQKGATDQKKGAVFTKLSRQITIAARGGGDPVTNFKLRLAIDTAKAASMPKENIERAIAKGTGADKEGAQLIEETYEGFGPGGTALIVEVVTDNKNRTYQAVRKMFSDQGGNLGGPGAVAWMFARRGVVRIANPHPTFGLPLPEGEGSGVRGDSALELKLIDAGADDLMQEDEGITVYTKPEELKAVEEKMRAMGFTPDSVGLEWVAKEKMVLPEATRETLEAFQDALDEMEDVSEYYTNT